MSLAFVPVYIKYLGIESYGLIGIFAVLQAWLVLLDMGMRPALVREMSRYLGGAHSPKSIRDLLRSVEIVVVVIALAIFALVWTISGWLATEWVTAKALPVEVIAQSFTVMGAVAALRFFENIYVSSIVGLQRQVMQNIVSVMMDTARGVGAVLVLFFVSPTLQAFFAWQGLISVLNVIVLGSCVYRVLPAAETAAHFSGAALLGIWRFAAGMMGITILSLLLMQVDKIVLSKILDLESFGYYAFAGSTAAALYLLVTPISTAFYPKFIELVTVGDRVSLHRVYHQSAQLVTVFVGSAGVILYTYADKILLLWTADHILSQNAAPVMRILVLGNTFNALMWMPYQMQLAHGWTGLSIKINVVGVGILIPSILLTVPRYGAVAAAWLWVCLNGSYLIISIFFMHRKILKTEKWRWYFFDILLPIAGGTVIATICKLTFVFELGRIGGILAITFIGVTTVIAAALSASMLREKLYQYSLHFMSYFASER